MLDNKKYLQIPRISSVRCARHFRGLESTFPSNLFDSFISGRIRKRLNQPFDDLKLLMYNPICIAIESVRSILNDRGKIAGVPV